MLAGHQSAVSHQLSRLETRETADLGYDRGDGDLRDATQSLQRLDHSTNLFRSFSDRLVEGLLQTSDACCHMFHFMEVIPKRRFQPRLLEVNLRLDPLQPGLGPKRNLVICGQSLSYAALRRRFPNRSVTRATATQVVGRSISAKPKSVTQSPGAFPDRAGIFISGSARQFFRSACYVYPRPAPKLRNKAPFKSLPKCCSSPPAGTLPRLPHVIGLGKSLV